MEKYSELKSMYLTLKKIDDLIYSNNSDEVYYNNSIISKRELNGHYAQCEYRMEKAFGECSADQLTDFLFEVIDMEPGCNRALLNMIRSIEDDQVLIKIAEKMQLFPPEKREKYVGALTDCLQNIKADDSLIELASKLNYPKDAFGLHFKEEKNVFEYLMSHMNGEQFAYGSLKSRLVGTQYVEKYVEAIMDCESIEKDNAFNLALLHYIGNRSISDDLRTKIITPYLSDYDKYGADFRFASAIWKNVCKFGNDEMKEQHFYRIKANNQVAKNENWYNLNETIQMQVIESIKNPEIVKRLIEDNQQLIMRQIEKHNIRPNYSEELIHRKEVEYEKFKLEHKNQLETALHTDKESKDPVTEIIAQYENLGIELTQAQKEMLTDKLSKQRKKDQLEEFRKSAPLRELSQQRAIKESKEISAENEKNAAITDEVQFMEKIAIEENIANLAKTCNALKVLLDMGIELTEEQLNLIEKYIIEQEFYRKKYGEFLKLENESIGVEQYSDFLGMNPEIRKQMQDFYNQQEENDIKKM